MGKRKNQELGYTNRSVRREILIHAHYHFIATTFVRKNFNIKWTWESPNGNSKSEIDFILIDNIITVTDANEANKFRTGNDHRTIRATITLTPNLERIKVVKKSTTMRIDMN